MEGSVIVSIISVITSLSSITFAILAFKRSEKNEHKSEGKSEGLIMSDIGYIKACDDRVEKNICKVDERYNDVLERLAKAEESLLNLTKRVDELLR